MEDLNTSLNSCLMLAINLDTPIGLSGVFNDADLKDTGVEYDSHITLLYAQSKLLPRKMILDDIKTILGTDWAEFETMMKEEHHFKVFNMFNLGCFENDSDYVVLKLKDNNKLFKMLNLINKGLRSKYKVSSDFATYTPHVTLAELQNGVAKKYLNSKELMMILRDTEFDIDDLILSYGTSGEPEDRKKYFLTQFNAVDRYFRLKREIDLNKNIDK